MQHIHGFVFPLFYNIPTHGMHQSKNWFYSSSIYNQSVLPFSNGQWLFSLFRSIQPIDYSSCLFQYNVWVHLSCCMSCSTIFSLTMHYVHNSIQKLIRSHLNQFEKRETRDKLNKNNSLKILQLTHTITKLATGNIWSSTKTPIHSKTVEMKISMEYYIVFFSFYLRISRYSRVCEVCVNHYSSYACNNILNISNGE